MAALPLHADLEGFRGALLSFYDSAARPLPWRASRDPYAIWISEVMSQQTRVDTVVPYYERWLDRFPDVHSLAAAPLEDVYKLWEGLGYYSRARNLHAAAQLVRERHGGEVPRSYGELRALPGIGDYTAGAVASIAFAEAEPAVDGNVRRVVARLLNEPAPAPGRLREIAQELVCRRRPGDFNQALMELGATVCTPTAPLCTSCPVATWCAARAAGTQNETPAQKVKRPVPVFDIATAVIVSPDRRLLVQQRPERGLLAGLWNFPGREVPRGSDPEDTARELAQSLCGALEERAAPLGTVEHTFSHRRERYHCYIVHAGDDECASPPCAAEAADGIMTRWIGADRRDVTLPRAQQKIHALAVSALNLSARATALG